VKLLSIMALKNILGNISGDNKMLQGHFDWLTETILKIKQKQMSMTLEAAPSTISSRAGTISSSFKTLG
jgi:hypothetical protein